MDKINRYEYIYIKVMCYFCMAGIIYNLLCTVNFVGYSQMDPVKILSNISFFAGIAGFNLFKHFAIKKNILTRKYHYEVVRVIEILILVIALVFLSLSEWAYLAIVLLIMITSLCKGVGNGFFYASLYMVTHFTSIMIYNHLYDVEIIDYLASKSLIIIIFSYFMAGFVAFLCGMIYKDNYNTELQNKKLLKELEEKYDLLAVAQQEIKYHYEKIKDTNRKLEETNSKLSVSIGEFYTLQQISQAISSIFSIKELLKYVNDIIIGVMGVNYSSIILYDEKRKRLKVHTTNIVNPEELIVFSNNINCEILIDTLGSGRPLMENFIDENEYCFTQQRGINSIICVPLMTKTKKFGLVLIEQKYNNAFDDGNVRLLDIISQQVSIAMENVELYQRMEELASIDGLTEVYNRLYFQQRLTKELQSARENNYDLAIAIFDVDYFKKFNDTYGHLFGDKVIKQMAELVKLSLQSTDVIARYGGEEFIVLFPRTGMREAYGKVEALRKKIAETSIRDELITTSITASFGISCYPVSGSTEIELLRKADDALYEAKANGRNCVRAAD